MIGIVDLGFSNVNSIEKALAFLNYPTVRICSVSDWKGYKKIIFPGVGSFNTAYHSLVNSGLENLIIDYCLKDGHFLGICLGMQLLFDFGFEGGQCKGMGLIKGEVRKISPYSDDERVPHNGWNTVSWQFDDPLWQGTLQEKDFYFNSYSVHTDGAYILGNTIYGNEGIVSAVRKSNMWGTQFHPEKSQASGLALLKNFIEYND